jgi:hypothetical protein
MCPQIISYEGRLTPSTFNLKYDGGIFMGLHDHGTPNNFFELYPEGTRVSFLIKMRPSI